MQKYLEPNHIFGNRLKGEVPCECAKGWGLPASRTWSEMVNSGGNLATLQKGKRSIYVGELSTSKCIHILERHEPYSGCQPTRRGALIGKSLQGMCLQTKMAMLAPMGSCRRRQWGRFCTGLHTEDRPIIHLAHVTLCRPSYPSDSLRTYPHTLQSMALWGPSYPSDPKSSRNTARLVPRSNDERTPN